MDTTTNSPATATPTKAIRRSKKASPDVIAAVKKHIIGLVDSNTSDDKYALSRKTIFKSAVDAGFEEKVIYRYMLHPDMKASTRGMYNVKTVVDAE